MSAASSVSAHTAAAAIVRMLQQSSEEEQRASRDAAAAGSASAAGAAAVPAPATSSSDTLRVAAIVLVMQVTLAHRQQQEEAAAAAATHAASSTGAAAPPAQPAAAAAATSPSPSPLFSFLPSVASYLPRAFLVRMLASGMGEGDPRLPPGSLPSVQAAAAAASSASPPPGASYPELALRALQEIAANAEAARVLLQMAPQTPESASSAASQPQPASCQLVLDVLLWLQGTLSVSSLPLDRAQVWQLALPLLDRFAQVVSSTAGVDPLRPPTPASVTLLHLQPLTSLLPPESMAHLSKEHACSVMRVLAWLLPGVIASAPLAQRSVAFKHLAPLVSTRLAASTGTEQSLHALRILLALYEGVQQEHAQEAHPSLKSMVPLPPHLASLRSGAEALLGSRIDLPQRVQVLRLCRLVLQRHGSLFATSPSTTTKSTSVQAPHVRFLQLLLNVAVVELRLGLFEVASPRPADRERIGADQLRRDGLVESMHIVAALLGALTEDDDEDDQATSSLRWHSLPSDMLTFFKNKLDESRAALLEFFAALQKHKFAVDAQVRREATQLLASYLSEDSQACERGDVHAVLPVLLEPLPSSASEHEPVISLLLPALLFLSTSPGALPALREARVASRLVEELIEPEFRRGVEVQEQLLTGSAAAGDDDDESMEAEESLARQVGTSLAQVGNACSVLANVLSADRSVARQLAAGTWAKLEGIVRTCLRVAKLPAVVNRCDLEEHVQSMEEALEWCTKHTEKKK